jgi:hypothetical protein
MLSIVREAVSWSAEAVDATLKAKSAGPSPKGNTIGRPNTLSL